MLRSIRVFVSKWIHTVNIQNGTSPILNVNISTKEKFDGTESHRIYPLVQKRGLPISFSCINIFMHE
jgi:hypothetical protein